MTPVTFAHAREIYLASLAAYSATDFTGMEAGRDDEITSNHYETWDELVQAPARSGADLLEKMAMIDARYMVDSESIPDVDWEALKRDVKNLTKPQIATDSPTCIARRSG